MSIPGFTWIKRDLASKKRFESAVAIPGRSLTIRRYNKLTRFTIEAMTDAAMRTPKMVASTSNAVGRRSFIGSAR